MRYVIIAIFLMFLIMVFSVAIIVPVTFDQRIDKEIKNCCNEDFRNFKDTINAEFYSDQTI